MRAALIVSQLEEGKPITCETLNIGAKAIVASVHFRVEYETVTKYILTGTSVEVNREPLQKAEWPAQCVNGTILASTS
jgi:hypothetical protein